MKLQNIVLVALFLVWISFFFVAQIVVPDVSFSEMENRPLQQIPTLSVANVTSGRFGDEFESYLNDQFLFRDSFIQLSTASQYAIGKREIGGVYFANDNNLMQTFSSIDLELTARNIQSIANYKQRTTVPVYTALIPSASAIQSDELPYGVPELDQRAMIDQFYEDIGDGCIDVYDSLNAQKEQDIYYRTDHHWTSLGAYYGYASIIKQLGQSPITLDTYTRTPLSDDFYGTLYSKAPAFWIYPDVIDAYVPDTGIKVSVFDGIETVEKALYYEENLTKKDKYTVFLGGNQPLITIETSHTDAPRLLVLRDSYFDSLAPFMTPHFSQIHLLDARYYRQGIDAYVAENDIDMVLLAYSLDQFTSAFNLSIVLDQ